MATCECCQPRRIGDEPEPELVPEPGSFRQGPGILSLGVV